MQDQHLDSQEPESKTLDGSIPLFYVGVGASAGGLEALESFFTHMAANSNMAFIVIQHLSPNYKSMMVELLSKRTTMAVRRAEEGMLVEANVVYLIPPKKNLSIFHGKLLLSESDHSRGLNLPIDVFLHSLADDQTEKAIGIILSGTGSDGVRGIRAIKEAGGMIMVQSEESAKFDGMPRAAISTGLADFILPPEEMPAKLLSFIRHPYALKTDRPPVLLSDEDGMARIFALLRERTRVDFAFYKPSTVVRRIERRMTVNQVNDLREYVKLMESYSGEVLALYRELLIGVTSFFRDREVFNALETHHLPQLFARLHTREARFWTAGCSTGEEAYSLAILSREILEQMGKRIDVKIFATDLDRNAIVRASSGLYPESIVVDLPPALLAKYFQRKEEHYRIDRSIREMVVFAQHNLIKDPPFTNIELVSCRNLLIYLQPVLQRKALELINFSLNPQGILLLGSSETTGDLADFFEPLNQKFRIYAAKGKRRPVSHPTEFSGVPETLPWQNRVRSISTPSRSHDEDQMLERFLQSLAGDYVPLAVVVNEQMEPLHILGDSDGYFRRPSGRQTNDITKNVVKDLAIPLATGLQKVFKTSEELKYTSIRIHWREELKTVQVRIRPLPGKKGQESLAAVFIEETASPKEAVGGGTPVYDINLEAEQRIHDLEQELQFSRENLQATIEELETSNEELQATNEELLASNEELQSTNEELQSVNEELHTVNAEHQSKIIELTELNNDLDNLMASTRIATLILDENLNVRRFTPEIRRIFRILDGDIGRPMNHLTHNLMDEDLLELVQDVTRRGVEKEREVRTREGDWLQMRILPYHIGVSAVSGVVLTFIDIGLLKTVQNMLSDRETLISSLYRASPVGVSRVANRILLDVNDQLCQALGYSREELVGRSARLLYPSTEEFEAVGKDLYEQIRKHSIGTMETRWRRKDGTVFPVLLNASSLHPGNPENGATFTALDLSIRKQETVKAQVNEERYRRLMDTLAEGVVYYNAQGEIISANPAAQRILGLSSDTATGQIAANPDWTVLREDGTEWPAEQQPPIIALRTGLPVKAAVMGLADRQPGQTRWLRVSAIPLFDPGKKTPVEIYSIFHDITESVETGHKLAQTQHELQELTRFAQPVLDALTTRIAALKNSSETASDPHAWQDCTRESLNMLQRLIEKIPTLSDPV
ncbi:MAG TPA: chemotaxis protein CheB [Candidatus Competibacteraceae bacterium]|nr:PAS domain S-box protein [Candidatus Competibacteraceae bacterium]HPF59361.1 chemotaxis protein CheB [Candidatus Competibacteraceae bacterium]HRY18816.1 chemotaxis protein CheB [Candidatus Competibacteraceae bacterium]